MTLIAVSFLVMKRNIDVHLSFRWMKASKVRLCSSFLFVSHAHNLSLFILSFSLSLTTSQIYFLSLFLPPISFSDSNSDSPSSSLSLLLNLSRSQYVCSRPWFDLPPSPTPPRKEEKSVDFLGIISETMGNMMNVLVTERHMSEESEAISMKLMNYDEVWGGKRGGSGLGEEMELFFYYLSC